MRIVLLYISIALGTFGLEAFSQAIPEEWRDVIRDDQRLNTPEWEMWIQSGSEQRYKPKKVFHVDVPVSDVEFLQARLVGDDTIRDQIVTLGSDGKPRVRVFFLEDKQGFANKIRAKYGDAVKQEHWGVFVRSHNTHFVYSNDPTKPPFYIKPQEPRSSRDLPRNGPESARAAVRRTNHVAEVLRTANAEHTRFLPESMAAVIDLEGESYAVTYRSTVPLGASQPEGTRMYSLHGALSEEASSRFAKAAGMSREDWLIKEYIPQLARHRAEAQLRFGLYGEEHSQNMVAYIDPNSGRIKGMGVRDLADVASDPFVRTSSGRSSLIERMGERGITQLNQPYLGHDGKPADRIFSIEDSYTLRLNQTVIFEQAPELNSRLAGEYAERMIAEFESQLGQKLKLDDDAKKAIHKMKTTKIQKYNLKKMLARTMQHIHDQSVRARLPELVPSEANRLALATKVESQVSRDRPAAFLSPDSNEWWQTAKDDIRKNAAFGYDGNGIIIYRRSDSKPMLYFYSISPSEHVDLIRGMGLIPCVDSSVERQLRDAS